VLLYLQVPLLHLLEPRDTDLDGLLDELVVDFIPKELANWFQVDFLVKIIELLVNIVEFFFDLGVQIPKA